MGCVESNSKNLNFFAGQQVLTKSCLNFGVDLPDALDTLYSTFGDLITDFHRVPNK